jgi:PAS domain S-box-containing protein
MKIEASPRLEVYVLLAALVVDVLFASMTAYFLINSRAHYRDGLNDGVHNVGRLLEQRIADKARLIDNAVVRVERELSRQKASGGVDVERLEILLDSEQRGLPEINAVRVTDAEGLVRWGKGVGPGAMVGASYADRAFFQRHRANPSQGLIITEPLQGKVSGQWVIAFTRCYRNPDGAFAGVVSAAVPVQAFGALLEPLSLGRNGTMVMRSDEMGLIARFPPVDGPEGQPGSTTVSPEFIRAAASGQAISTFHCARTQDAVERTYAFHRVSGWPFTIAVGMVDQEYWGHWQSQVIWAIGLVAVFFAATWILAWKGLQGLRERAAREEARREQVVLRRILIEQSRDGIVALDHTGKVWEANQRFADMLGYSPEEIQHLHVWDWDAQWSREQLLEMVKRCGPTGEFLETRHRRKNGEMFDVEISSNGVVYRGAKIVLCVCRDATERKRAEQTIRENEQRLRTLINSTPDFICFKDGHNRWLEANQALIDLFALANVEYRGKTNAELVEFTEPVFRASLLACESTDQLAWQANSVSRGEEAIHRPDGSTSVYDVVKAPIFEADGSRKALVVLGRDITERKRAETALRESEARMRAITDSAKEAIVMMNAAGLISYWNPAAERIFGYASHEAMGVNLHRLIAPSRYLRAYEAAFARYLRTGQSSIQDAAIELQACRKDGREISVELSVAALSLQEGGQTLGIVRDVTERKKTEEALRESEERFRTLHNASFGGILIHDQGMILDCNQGASDLTGFSADQLVGMDVLLLIAPDWRDLARRNIERQCEQPYDVEGLRKDGTLYPLNIRGAAIPYKGRVVRVTEFRDVTERKRAEAERKSLQAQLIQAQKMEAIGTLAGGIAHDFNNILGAVIGYAEMARDGCPAGSDAARDLNRVLEAGHRAASLVKQILAFSRQIDTERVRVEPARIIKEAIALLRPILPSTIVVKQQVDDATASVFADPTQFHQIVMNLCTNAFHAMEQTGGTLEIALGECELSERDLKAQPEAAAGTFVALTVRDSGPGIPPEIRDKIFDPYFTTKEVGKGAGMGLAIIHGIVTTSGGFVVCDSELGKGTVFRVFFPALERGEAETPVAAAPAPTGKEHILLVDDEEMLADMGQTMLERLGYEVTVRTSSLEALNAFQNQPDRFDAVITDQTMPGMTGLDLARRMLQIRPGMPIILCTGHSNLASEAQAKLYGIRGYAMKPLTKSAIATLLRQVLEEERT